MTDHPSPPLTPHGRSIWLFVATGGALICLLALPIGALLWRAVMAGLIGQVTEPAAIAALRLSLLTSSLASLIAVITGTPLAYVLARWSFRWKRWINMLIDLPVVLPPAVAGLALLMAFGRRGVFGDLLAAAGISLPFTPAAVVIAQIFVAAPLYVRAAVIGFAAIDPQLEEAAYSEGAGAWQSFRYVMLPLARRALLGGLVLCWTRALGEFGATILFAGNMPGLTQTMPLAIYLGLERDLGVALALSAVLLLISIFLLAVLRRLEQPA